MLNTKVTMTKYKWNSYFFHIISPNTDECSVEDTYKYIFPLVFVHSKWALTIIFIKSNKDL